ncbi:hypothetical protein [Demequina sp.]|uniref:hypothetical protein n=1 Tax=Demequina sp. TaxID=2050685 RepID=UPI003D125098
MLTGEVLDGRFEALHTVEYDLPGITRYEGVDTRLNTTVLVDEVTSVAPTAVRRAALRFMSVRDPRLSRVVAVTGGSAGSPTVIVSEPLQGVRLSTILARRRLDEAKASAVVGEAARALLVASAARVHHGWVRPSCIAVDSRGRVSIAGTGVDSELALQAGVRRGKGEGADATALSRVFLACVTGKDADEATEADIPQSTSAEARALCERVLAGKSFDTLTGLLDALGPFDTRVLRNLPSGVDSLPLSLTKQAEAEKKRKRDKLDAARRAFTGPRVTGGVTIARETLVKAEVEAEAVSGSIPLVVAGSPVTPVVEEEPLEDLHDLLTFEEMVDEQVARSKPTTAELFYERLHARWPQSRGITKRLERAHYRAVNGGPINATPILMVLLVIGLVVLAIVAVSLLSQGFGQDDPGGGGNIYPTYSYGP